MRRLLAACALGAAVVVSACQSGGPAAGLDQVSRPGDNSALSTMERIAVAAQACWFKSNNPAFAGLAMSPELTSFSGKPRVLAVPRGNIGGLPKLVVEAQGKPARLSAYGPIMQGPHAAAISADINRWAAGGNSCSTRA